MQYNKMGRTGLDISKISLGAEFLQEKPLEVVQEVIGSALDYGVNYIDVFMPQPEVRDFIGKALVGKRNQVMLAGHIGAVLSEDGQYDRIRDSKRAVAHIEDFIKRLGGECVDMLMIHFVDLMEDAERVLAPGGLLDAAKKLQQQGKARFIGLSSHVPSVAAYLVDTGAIDTVLFNINPLHDTLGDVQIETFFKDDSYQQITKGISQERKDFFATCQRNGTAIISMKTYGGGRLLAPDAPLGVQLTPSQCIHYALSQPGVCSSAIGCQSRSEVDAAMAYLTATEEEKDFSLISSSRLYGAKGACMYCNHCLPCPVGIDIAAATRILDSTKKGITKPLHAAYDALTVKPSACIDCGACATRCPFLVDAPANMKALASLF